MITISQRTTLRTQFLAAVAGKPGIRWAERHNDSSLTFSVTNAAINILVRFTEAEALWSGHINNDRFDAVDLATLLTEMLTDARDRLAAQKTAADDDITVLT